MILIKFGTLLVIYLKFVNLRKIIKEAIFYIIDNFIILKLDI